MGTGAARIGILVVAYNAEATLRDVLQRISPDIMAKIEEIFVLSFGSSCVPLLGLM